MTWIREVIRLQQPAEGAVHASRQTEYRRFFAYYVRRLILSIWSIYILASTIPPPPLPDAVSGYQRTLLENYSV